MSRIQVRKILVKIMVFFLKYDFIFLIIIIKRYGKEYGKYIKIYNSTISENNIINIGDIYMIFSYQIYLNFGKDNRIKSHKIIILKIYNKQGEYEPIILGVDFVVGDFSGKVLK